MPRSASLPKKKLVDGVWFEFISENVVSQSRQPVAKWRCQHPHCSNPMLSHSTNLSRHVRMRHSEDYKAYRTTGAIVRTEHGGHAHAEQGCRPYTLGAGPGSDALQEDPPHSDEPLMTGREASPQVDIQEAQQQVQPFHTLCFLTLASLPPLCLPLPHAPTHLPDIVTIDVLLLLLPSHYALFHYLANWPNLRLLLCLHSPHNLLAPRLP
jgi:hypothetical protein